MAHQKRLSAPKHYPIKRKGSSAYVITGEGPHPIEEGIPLAVFLRDVTPYAANLSEAREILNNRNVHINGRVEKDPRRTVGFMDLIKLDKVDKSYRVLREKDNMVFKEVDDSGKRLYQVRDKTTQKGGKTQLNLDSGENKITEEDYSTYGTVVVDLDSHDIEDYLPLEEGSLVYITEGKHAGETAEVESIEIVKGSQSNRILLEQDGKEFETTQDHIFVVGKGTPEVEL